MERVDALHRAPETTPVVDLLELPRDQIITIKAGAYSGLGGGEVPDHAVNLAEDRSLFPLTLGFLKQFSSVKLVRKVLKNRSNKDQPEDKLVKGININLALALLRIINPNLLGGVRLKLPAEAVLSVFFGQEEFMNVLGRTAFLLTATPYTGHGLITPETADIELEEIKNDDRFVYRYGLIDPGDQTYQIGRHAHPSDSTLVCSALFEVVAA